jgi:transcriptional regulator with XRE-family HTH domain
MIFMTPAEIDQHVGRRIRLFRKANDLSQEKLAERIGVTFQQVQKYERGANRVSASKLYQIAEVLQVDVASLFEGLPGAGRMDGTPAHPGMAADCFPMAPSAAELVDSFARITDPRCRRAVVELIRSIADGVSGNAMEAAHKGRLATSLAIL